MSGNHRSTKTAARPSPATKHTDFEQEQTEFAEAVTTLCSLGYLLFKKCVHGVRDLIVCRTARDVRMLCAGTDPGHARHDQRQATSGKLQASDTFAQSSYVAWTTNQYTECCVLDSTRVYHTIPASGEGESGTHYDQTDFQYKSPQIMNWQKTPGGTITFTVFDARGKPPVRDAMDVPQVFVQRSIAVQEHHPPLHRFLPIPRRSSVLRTSR